MGVWTHDEVVKPAAAAQAADGSRDVVDIGDSIVIKGEVKGNEDLTIEGRVEGKIELRQHVLTIGRNGKIKAEVFAKSIVVFGEITGNVTATDTVDIRDNGSVDGDITAARVAIAEGAHFRGSVDMQRHVSSQLDLDSPGILVEVCVPQSGSETKRRAASLKRAVHELLATFDYVRDPGTAKGALKSSPARETHLGSTA